MCSPLRCTRSAERIDSLFQGRCPLQGLFCGTRVLTRGLKSRGLGAVRRGAPRALAGGFPVGEGAMGMTSWCDMSTRCAAARYSHGVVAARGAEGRAEVPHHGAWGHRRASQRQSGRQLLCVLQ